MSFYALTTGALIADPQSRQGARGAFATAAIRVSTGDGEATIVSVIAFGDEAGRLLEYQRGDALAVSGRAKLTSWTGRDGGERHGLSVVCEQIASAKPRPKAQGERNAAPGNRASPRLPLRQRPPARPAGDPRPFDDRLDDIGAEP